MVLFDMYRSMNGMAWSWDGQGNVWNFSAPYPCADSWQGVTCSSGVNSIAHITSIELHYYGLNGTIPASIGNLTELVVLNLSDNQINGTVPATIGNLTALEDLDLSATHLSGTLPPSVVNLVNLLHISLVDTLMEGTLPTVLCHLTQLVSVGIESCRLWGTLPSCYGQLIQLTSLYIGNTPTLTGSIPGTFQNLTRLQLLSLYGNALTGRVPDIFYGMTFLNTLELYGNSLSGTLPESMSALQSLETLTLFNNGLNGTLPAALVALPLLSDIDLDENAFSGPLQLPCSDASNLGTFVASGNRFTGSIPATVGKCTQLGVLDLSYCRLSGTLPTSLWSLTGLRELYVSYNSLSGTLPSTLSRLEALSAISLDHNLFSGTIPPAPQVYSKMVSFQVNDNFLSGTLPPHLLQSRSLAALSIGDNLLSGTIPAVSPQQAGARLRTVLCGNNKLSGTIPESLRFRGETLAFLNLSNNYLTGTLSPALITSLTHINFLYASDNALTGPFPANWSVCGLLSFLFLDSNYLTGTLPVTLATAPSLHSLNLSHNHLSGALPATHQQTARLQVLMLHHNHLSGNLSAFFNASAQPRLSAVQLSGNQFTGTLPAELFALPRLASFAAVSNCLGEMLPVEAICNSSTLSALVLDGMRTAAACRLNYHLSFSDAYSTTQTLTQTLPECLFTTPTLITLHLSGIGLSGTIPPDVDVSRALEDLSLSHNQLTGTIPFNLMGRAWANLDVSYNRLTGTLDSARSAPYSGATTVYAQDNRLSGVIPGSLQHAGTISILEGNLFSCQADRSDLPSRDEQVGKYTCGSDDVNNFLYVWIGLACCCAAGIAFARQVHLGQWVSTGLQWWQVAHHSAGKLQNYSTLLRSCYCVCVLGTAAATYCLVVLVPLYASASSTSQNGYTHQYAWTVSGAFLDGDAAFATEMTFLLLLVLLCGVLLEWCTTYNVRGSAPTIITTQDSVTALNLEASSQRVLLYAAYLLINLIVVVGVNIAFVLATLRVSGRELSAIQVLLAMFKLGFNNVVAPVARRYIAQRLSRGGGSLLQAEFAALQLYMSLFNNIVIPCLVVVVISPSCFYNVFHAADDVVSSYAYNGTCSTVGVAGMDQQGFLYECTGAQLTVDTTAYSPPFTYNYQCSSSFVTYYAPSFVFMCVISAFLSPMLRMLLMWLRTCLQVGTRAHTLVTSVLPRILLDPADRSTADARSPPLWDPAQHFNALLTYLALLLTFGALFPPLAVCCAVTMVALEVVARLQVGRYVAAAERSDQTACFTAIDDLCRTVMSVDQMSAVVRTILAVTCWFYTLFLFDTLGDAMGFAHAFWVLIVVPLLPLAVALWRWVWRRSRVHEQTIPAGPAKDAGKSEVELADVEAGVIVDDVSGSTNPIHSFDEAT
jgi:Leucine-rich repeat (LRR) protein